MLILKPSRHIQRYISSACQRNFLRYSQICVLLCTQHNRHKTSLSHVIDTARHSKNERSYISRSNSNVDECFKQVMRQVPQPVVVVTTALPQNPGGWLRRGITCSSFTSVSVKPPIISFCMNNPSRMHNLLIETKKFAIHILAKDQIRYGMHFSKPISNGQDQFENVPYTSNDQGIPILSGANAVLECESHHVDTVGDHSVWYGQVTDTLISTDVNEPLLYYAKSFRSIGDESFMQAFENRTLPFEDWTHEAHLRMAWNYIREYGKEEATPLIRQGINRYNEINKHKISRGYNETVTMFYIHMLADAINKYIGLDSDVNFDEFIISNKYLKEGDLLFKYYSKAVIGSNQAVTEFVPPDVQPLPT